MIKNIHPERIKKKMIELLADKKTRYLDEIANELSLDIRDVAEAFTQLQTEGKLFVNDKNT